MPGYALVSEKVVAPVVPTTLNEGAPSRRRSMRKPPWFVALLVHVRSTCVAPVAEAATAEGGRPHAEEQCLSAAGALAKGATAYVTLEPCGERSSGGPSCAELLARAGVGRVVIACADPSDKASGRGIERLRAAGVTVEVGLLEDEAAPLYADYISALNSSRRLA